MQDPSIYSQINSHSQFPEPELLKCPRCDSTNTKFCYYNNYNLSQPRHFCKSCKRYWTKGGTLRNIPVGGGSRKNSKRSSGAGSVATENSHQSKRPAAGASAPTSASNNSNNNDNSNRVAAIPESYKGQFGNFMEESGSFSSLLGSSGGQFGNSLDGLGGPDGSGLQLSEHFGGAGPGSGRVLDPQMGLESGNSNTGDSDRFLNVDGGGDSSGCWITGGNGWPDLAIYTRGSTFQK